MSEELSYSWRGKGGGRIRVTVEPSWNQANVCRFIVEPALYPDGGAYFSKGRDADGSPLAAVLFEIADLTEVLIAGNTVTLTTETAPDWTELSSKIAAAIRDQIDSRVPAVSDSFTSSLPGPEVVRERVQHVIDTSINPAVASHGGVVKLLDVQGNNIFLEFGGGCQGCGMVSVTLKYGVERLLRDQVPEVGQILDTTDHASGQNPYYAPSAK
ncbi:MAG: NifU family protein [Candidatus Krumholzibacteriia bacterium]